MFAEAMAVNYYELDLANASQRYVLQELLHIAVFEEGENIVQLQYQGCDYKMPASWINEVPRTGNISLFYARTKQVIKDVMEKGSCDARKHPNPLHHEKYFPPDGPQWKETWDLGGQAAGLQWIDAYKMPLGLISPTTPPDSLRYASNNRSLLLRASSLLPVGILNEACLGLLCVPQPRDFSPRRRCCLGAVLGRETMQT